MVKSYPELESPEDKSQDIDPDFVPTGPFSTEATDEGSKSFDWSKYTSSGDKPVDCYDDQGNLLPDEAAAFNGFAVDCGPGRIAKPKTERVHVPKPRLHDVEQAEACQKQVVAQYAKGDVKVYRRKMNDCLVPYFVWDKNRIAVNIADDTREVPDKAALKKDIETNPKSTIVRVPKGGVIAFPASMTESQMKSVCKTTYKQITAAEHKARIKTGSYWFAILGVFFYLLQAGYRVLIYVAFGGVQES